jgi:hypothetical protein
MRNRALVTAALTAAALGVFASTTGAAAQTKVPRDCIHEAFKPHHITITCADGNFFLSGLKWSHWGRKMAAGKGTANINDCMPFCAQGHFHKYPVKVKLSSAHFCRNAGQTQFRRIRVTFTRSMPTGFKQTSSQPIACPLK